MMLQLIWLPASIVAPLILAIMDIGASTFIALAVLVVIIPFECFIIYFY
jgi:hypothetical protein